VDCWDDVTEGGRRRRATEGGRVGGRVEGGLVEGGRGGAAAGGGSIIMAREVAEKRKLGEGLQR